MGSVQYSREIKSRAENLRIGQWSAGNYFYNGKIDDIRIYSRALNPAEVDSLYHVEGWPLQEPPNSLIAYYPFNGNANDESGNGYTGTVDGPQLTSDRFGNPGSAYFFPETSSITTDSLHLELYSFSLNLWVKTERPMQNKYTGIFNSGYLQGGVQVDMDGEGGYCYYGNHMVDSTRVAIGPATYKWSQLTIVKDFNIVSVYYNAVLTNTFLQDTTITFKWFQVGKHRAQSSAYDFHGYVDDISIYSGALSQDQIDSLYSLNEWAGDSSSGLIAYYPFNGNANDESGNGNDGTVYGASLTMDRFGDANSAYSFDGVDDFISVKDNDRLELEDDFSISIWMKLLTASEPAGRLVLSKHMANFENDNSWAFLLQERNFSFNNSNVSVIEKIKSSYGNYPRIGRWDQVVVTYKKDAKTLKFYMNGKLDTSVTSKDVVIENTIHDLLIGNETIDSSAGPGSAQPFKGGLDDLYIFKRVLTSVEIDSLFNIGGWPLQDTINSLVAYYPFNGNANDESGNGNDGTVNGAALTEDRFGNANSAYSFNGASYINLGNQTALDFGTSPFTIVAWMKTLSSEKEVIVMKGGDEAGGARWMLSVNEMAVNKTNFILDDNTSKYQQNDLLDVNDNRWHMVAGVRNGTDMILYVDGVPSAITALEASYDLSGTSQGNAYIGAGFSYASSSIFKFFNGIIDDISIYNRALSSAEIDSLYHFGGWPSTADPNLYLFDSRDEQIYKKVTIGTQTWMAENLNYQPASGNSWCYDNKDSLCNIYGRLYDWNTAVADDHGNGFDVCPEGWHLPNDGEWSILENAVGSISTAGQKLKSAVWDGTDEYNFAALPSGLRHSSDGLFYQLGSDAHFWTSTDYNINGWYRNLRTGIDSVYRMYLDKYYGRSVRCLEDDPIHPEEYPDSAWVKITFYDHYSERDLGGGYNEFSIRYWIPHSTPGMVQDKLNPVTWRPQFKPFPDLVCETWPTIPDCDSIGYKPWWGKWSYAKDTLRLNQQISDTNLARCPDCLMHNRYIDTWWTENNSPNDEEDVYMLNDSILFVHDDSEPGIYFFHSGTHFRQNGKGWVMLPWHLDTTGNYLDGPFISPSHVQRGKDQGLSPLMQPEYTRGAGWAAHLQGKFLYDEGFANIILDVRADDDLFVFVNGNLIMDLGGVHTLSLTDTNFETILAALGLSTGDTCMVDFFMANRNVGGAFMFRTNLPLFAWQ